MLKLKYFLLKLDASLHALFNPPSVAPLAQNEVPFLFINRDGVQVMLTNDMNDEHSMDIGLYIKFVEYVKGMDSDTFQLLMDELVNGDD